MNFQYATTEDVKFLDSTILSLLLREVFFVVFDVETTGLNAFKDRMTQVAAKVFSLDGSYSKLKSWELNPEVPIPEFITKLTGHTDASVATMPRFEDVAEEILQFLSQGVLVAHNSVFDLRFLAAAAREADMELPFLPVVDTLLIARTKYRFPDNKLETVVRELGVEIRNAHRADEDVTMTADVLQRMITDHSPERVRDLVDLSGGLITSVPVVSSRKTRVVRSAIDRHEPIEIQYKSGKGEETSRLISPWDMVGGYITAYCHLRKEERRFRIDRLSNAVPQPFEVYVSEEKYLN